MNIICIFTTFLDMMWKFTHEVFEMILKDFFYAISPRNNWTLEQNQACMHVKEFNMELQDLENYPIKELKEIWLQYFDKPSDSNSKSFYVSRI